MSKHHLTPEQYRDYRRQLLGASRYFRQTLGPKAQRGVQASMIAARKRAGL